MAEAALKPISEEARGKLKRSLSSNKRNFNQEIEPTTRKQLKSMVKNQCDDGEGASSSPSKNSKSDQEKKMELLERNRAAAQRSREKKKRLGEVMESKLKLLTSSNKNLSRENELLREELANVKSMLKLHMGCSVSQANPNHLSEVREAIQPKLIPYSSSEPAQVKVVKVDGTSCKTPLVKILSTGDSSGENQAVLKIALDANIASDA